MYMFTVKNIFIIIIIIIYKIHVSKDDYLIGLTF